MSLVKMFGLEERAAKMHAQTGVDPEVFARSVVVKEARKRGLDPDVVIEERKRLDARGDGVARLGAIHEPTAPKADNIKEIVRILRAAGLDPTVPAKIAKVLGLDATATWTDVTTAIAKYGAALTQAEALVAGDSAPAPDFATAKSRVKPLGKMSCKELAKLSCKCKHGTPRAGCEHGPAGCGEAKCSVVPERDGNGGYTLGGDPLFVR